MFFIFILSIMDADTSICITQTTAEIYCITVMKNRTTSNSVQTWITKTVNHYSAYPDLFAGSHLLNMQNFFFTETFRSPVSQFY